MQYPVGMEFNPDTVRNEMIEFLEYFIFAGSDKQVFPYRTFRLGFGRIVRCGCKFMVLA